MDDSAMDVKQITAKWTTGYMSDMDSIGVAYANSIQQEIDNEIMVDMLKMNGWYVVKLDRFKDMRHPIDVKDWCDETIGTTESWSNYGTTFLFKESKHAEWFSLRWL